MGTGWALVGAATLKTVAGQRGKIQRVNSCTLTLFGFAQTELGKKLAAEFNNPDGVAPPSPPGGETSPASRAVPGTAWWVAALAAFGYFVAAQR